MANSIRLFVSGRVSAARRPAGAGRRRGRGRGGRGRGGGGRRRGRGGRGGRRGVVVPVGGCADAVAGRARVGGGGAVGPVAELTQAWAVPAPAGEIRDRDGGPV